MGVTVKEGGASAPKPLSDHTALSPGEGYAFRPFTEKDGLPQKDVRSLAVDRKGYIWIGTLNGAAYYNGRSWTVLNMPDRTISNRVYSLCAASDGSLWFGTDGNGLIHYEQGRWTIYNTKNSKLPNNTIFNLLESKTSQNTSVMWAATQAGLVRLADGKVETFNQQNSGLPNDEISCLLETGSASKHPALWVGTSGGLSRFSDGTWTSFKQEVTGILTKSIYSLLETDADSGHPTLWIGTTLGLVRFNDGVWTIFNSENSGLQSNKIWSLLVTGGSPGHPILWIGTLGGGLTRFSEGGWTTFTTKNTGFVSNDVYGLMVSGTNQGQHIMWVATDSGVVAAYMAGGWSVLNLEGLGMASNWAWSLLEAQTPKAGFELWIGTTKGLIRRTPDTWTALTSQNSGLSGNQVLCLLDRSPSSGVHQLWAGTLDGGLSCLENNQWTTYTTSNSGLPDNQVCSLLDTISTTGIHSLWVATSSNGIACFREGNWTTYDTSNSGLPDNRIDCLYETIDARQQHLLWIGTAGGLVRFGDPGVLKFDPTATPQNQWKVFTTENSGLRNNRVHTLFETVSANGIHYLWMGTASGGVARLNLDLPDEPWFSLSDETQPALPSNTIYQIREDFQKRIYLCTTKGIVRLTPRKPLAESPAEYSMYCFTTADGLPNNSCSWAPNSTMVDHLGRMWVGTSNGIGILDVTKVSEDHTSKPLFIEKIVINSNPSPVSNHLQPLSYSQNSITFEFALLGFFRESDTRYQTQLTGFDQSVSDWTSEYKRVYTNLPEGEFLFQVWGKDHAGNLTGPVTVAFRIQAAPWRTWWAYALYTLVLFSVGYQGYGWRIRVLHRRQNEKIRYLGQLLESTRLINSQLDLKTVLQKIAGESARLVDGLPGGIGLVENEGVVFRRFWDGVDWQDENFVVPLGASLAGLVALNGTPAIVNDIETLPDPAFREFLTKNKICGVLQVPITTRTGTVVGVLSVFRTKHRVPFNETDCQLLISLANQAAVAIENASLYGELEKLFQKEQDVTKRLQELNRMKTNFIVVTSHEIRTPLTVLKGYTETLHEEVFGPLNELQSSLLGICHRMVDRMVMTFNDILEMLKINEGRSTLRKQTIKVQELVSDILVDLEVFVSKRGQHIHRHFPEELCLNADPEKIRIVLLNLIQNAVKFTPDGGDIHLRVIKEAGALHFTVQDSGIGIATDEIDRIFDMFYTTSNTDTHSSGRFEFSARGTGLGLTIAKNYVELHGGRIWAESGGMDQGSCFHVVLPHPLAD